MDSGNDGLLIDSGSDELSMGSSNDGLLIASGGDWLSSSSSDDESKKIE